MKKRIVSLLLSFTLACMGFTPTYAMGELPETESSVEQVIEMEETDKEAEVSEKTEAAAISGTEEDVETLLSSVADVSGQCGDNLTWVYDSGTLTISGTGEMWPYSSTNDQPWDAYKSVITSVVIEEGVTSIGDYAFYGYSTIVNLVLPETLTQICSYSFYSCKKLTDIIFPEGLQVIGSYAFAYCNGITEIIFPQNLESLGSYAFYYCQYLASVIIQGNLKSIQKYTFSHCTELNHVALSENIETIEEYAFDGCSGLVSVVFPRNVVLISHYAFRSCRKLATIRFESPVIPSIPYRDSGGHSYPAFYGVTAYAYYPDCWTSVPTDSYGGNLTWISYKSDEEDVLKYLIQPESNSYIAGDTVTFSVQVQGEGLTYQWQHNSRTSWTNISNDTVYQGADTETLQFTAASSHNGYKYRCVVQDTYGRKIYSNVATLTVEEPYTAKGTCGENLSWVLDENGLLTISGTGAMTSFSAASDAPWYAYKDSITDIAIASGVTSVGDYAFTDYSTLTTITLFDTVTEIGSYALKGTGLTQITLPQCIEAIGSEALAECSSLSTIRFEGVLPNIAADGFASVTATAQYPSSWLAAPEENYGGELTWTVYDSGYSLKITLQPVNKTIMAMETAVLVIKAKGDGLSYQWQYQVEDGEWMDLPEGNGFTGVTTDTLSMTVSESYDGIQYRCMVSDIYGRSIYSDSAVVNVKVPELGIVKQPSDYRGSIGTTAEFSITANNASSYQWQYHEADDDIWKDVENGVGATVSVAITASSDGQIYRCVVSDERGNTVISDEAVLNISNELQIYTQPSDFHGKIGATASFTIAAVGDDITYQWQYQNAGSDTWKNSSMSGNKAATISVQITSTRNGQKYRCIVTDVYGNSLTSDAAVLYSAELLAITSQPSDVSQKAGEKAVFSIGATGAFAYQWQYRNSEEENWVDVENGTADTLTVIVTNEQDRQAFRCIVSDEEGNQLISEEAILYVKRALEIISQPLDCIGEIGEYASFAVAAVGEQISYQWQYQNAGSSVWKNSSMSGNNSSAISIVITETRNNQKYRCIVADADGNQLISNEAQIVIQKEIELEILSQPADCRGQIGEKAVFSVEAVGEGITYQWQYQNIGSAVWKDSSQNGCNSSSLLIEITEGRSGQKYRCVVTDKNGNTVISDSAQITVEVELAIISQPEDYTGKVGDMAVFTVEAAGNGLTYQWQYQNVGTTQWKNSSQAGYNTNTLAVPVTEARNGQKYCCVITDETNRSITTESVVLYVN